MGKSVFNLTTEEGVAQYDQWVQRLLGKNRVVIIDDTVKINKRVKAGVVVTETRPCKALVHVENNH